MLTVLSQKDRIILPLAVRQQLHPSPGDVFEVDVEDGHTLTFRRFAQPANRGLVDLLLACPSPFEVPPRETDFPAIRPVLIPSPL